MLLLLWLLTIIVQFEWSKQMRESERAHLPFTVLFNIYLSDHKRIDGFPFADHCHQVNVV